MVVYKVVYRTREGLLTSASILYPSTWAIVYSPKKETFPNVPGTKIFAFNSFENAERYKEIIGPSCYEIWEAKGKKVAPIDEIPYINLDNSLWEKFWKEGLYPDLLFATPKGTVVCSSITLLEKIA